MPDPMPALNRLCKWRAHFAGWMLGTRAKEDPEAQAVRDIFEKYLLLRVEVTALTKILLEKRVLTLEELHAALIAEAEELMRMLEERWPGVRAVDDGLSYDAEKVKAATWWRNWKP